MALVCPFFVLNPITRNHCGAQNGRGSAYIFKNDKGCLNYETISRIESARFEPRVGGAVRRDDAG